MTRDQWKGLATYLAMLAALVGFVAVCWLVGSKPCTDAGGVSVRGTCIDRSAVIQP